MDVAESTGATTPINEFIVKVASRCNLDCDYCYEYHAGDESWRRMPKFMSQETCDYLAFRVAEHAREHGLKHVFVTFHGGEPTLAGPRRLAGYCDSFTAAAASTFDIDFSIQTNATLIDDALCDVIRQKNIAVSVSLDGGRLANDLHRRDHAGRSSYEVVANGITRLKEKVGPLLVGLLAVVDVTTDPIQVFDELAEFGLDSIEFLLPHHHWDRPPPRPNGDELAYGRWYFELFKGWVAGRHPAVNIRFFVNILSQMVGRGGVFEAMNLSPASLVTINAIGEYEAVDCIKSTGSGAQAIGFAVQSKTVSSLLQHPAIQVRQSGQGQLAQACLICQHKTVCAGGYFPHRYSELRGFDNPSVYCRDLYWLIDAIAEHIKSRGSRVGRNI